MSFFMVVDFVIYMCNSEFSVFFLQSRCVICFSEVNYFLGHLLINVAMLAQGLKLKECSVYVAPF
jgi:hypothetical protein